MRVDVVTIFPEMFEPWVRTSILKRAHQKKKADVRIHDLRDYAQGRYRMVDDRPFGGGPGMILMPGPLFAAVRAIRGRRKARVILTCPQGRPFRQSVARRLAGERNLILICGHYEGVDERVRTHLVDETLSIGDYVLTGGELPAMVIVDAVVRLIPGVLGRADSLVSESFEEGGLEYPQYTRPADFKGLKVPEVLLSGHHERIAAWRREQALMRTRAQRPDLLEGPDRM